MKNREKAAADLQDIMQFLAGQKDQGPQSMEVDEAARQPVPDTPVGSTLGSGHKAQRKDSKQGGGDVSRVRSVSPGERGNPSEPKRASTPEIVLQYKPAVKAQGQKGKVGSQDSRGVRQAN